MPEDEIGWVDGIPVTSVPRTILDLAASLPRAQLERAMNEVEVRGLWDRLSVPDLLERYPRRPGTAALRALLRDQLAMRGVTQNDFEERFAALLDAHGLPKPRFNADVAVRGRFFKVDCHWAAARLVVELDGRASHDTVRAFERDRERDRLLLVDGWQVVRVTWRQLRDEPRIVVADLRRLLHRAPASTL